MSQVCNIPVFTMALLICSLFFVTRPNSTHCDCCQFAIQHAVLLSHKVCTKYSWKL